MMENKIDDRQKDYNEWNTKIKDITVQLTKAFKELLQNGPKSTENNILSMLLEDKEFEEVLRTEVTKSITNSAKIFLFGDNDE